METSTQKKFAISISNSNKELNFIRKRFISPNSFDGSPQNTISFLKDISSFCSNYEKFISNHLNHASRKSQSAKYLRLIINTEQEVSKKITEVLSKLKKCEDMDFTQEQKTLQSCLETRDNVKAVMTELSKLSQSCYTCASKSNDVTSSFAVLKSQTVKKRFENTYDQLNIIIENSNDLYERYFNAINNLYKIKERADEQLKSIYEIYSRKFGIDSSSTKTHDIFKEYKPKKFQKPQNTNLKEIEKIIKDNDDYYSKHIKDMKNGLDNKLKNLNEEYLQEVKKRLEEISKLLPNNKLEKHLESRLNRYGIFSEKVKKDKTNLIVLEGQANDIIKDNEETKAKEMITKIITDKFGSKFNL